MKFFFFYNIIKNILNYILSIQSEQFLNSFLILANFIYILGILGIILNQKNFLINMLFIEVMYTGIFIYFLISSIFLNSLLGQVFALIILISAACESVIGLGILSIIFRFDNSLIFQNFVELRG